LIAFIAIYANQVYHGTLLSTVPTLAMLLVGVCQRPHPSKNFWQFIIFWIEFTIILKYFFDFNIFSFNSNCESEPIPGDLSVVLGIDKSCGNLFVDLITELIV
jgi:hypothetical protein